MRITFAQGLKKFKGPPGQTRIIDVREKDEFQEGHLPQAELYPPDILCPKCPGWSL